jgi:enoyl-CoA hydratase
MVENAEILFHVGNRGVAVLTVNRPEARNALNWAAQEHFAEHVMALAGMTGVRALIITGAGEQSFMSGGDLKELCCRPDEAAGRRLNAVMGAALAQLAELPFPVIAAINGDAFGGGCEVLTACDLRLAHTRAHFSFAQVRNGLTTGWGGAARLVRQIGQSQALELLLSGRLFDAAEAQRLGWVHRLALPGANVREAAREWGEELAALPAGALAGLKQLAYASPDLDPASARALEAGLFRALWGQADHQEALAAFVEKRPPVFNQQAPSEGS